MILADFLKKLSMTQTKQSCTFLVHTSDLVKKTNYNAKITEIEGKIPSISGLATNAQLTAVENKITNIPELTQKSLKLKRNLLIIIMINILLLQSLIL